MSTIITINPTDALESTSRVNINTNFANLNADKVEKTGDTMTGALNIHGSQAASVQLRVRGATSQSANLLELQDSTATVVGAITVGGAMILGGSAPVASALLELVSTTKGFLPPRMTTAQRDAVASPASGLMLFNTTLNLAQLFVSATWQSVMTRREVSLTDGATINVDAALGTDFYVTLGGNRTLATPTNPTAGKMIYFWIKQDATGSRTLTFGAGYRFGTDIPSITLSTAANKTDYIACKYNSNDNVWDVLAFNKGF